MKKMSKKHRCGISMKLKDECKKVVKSLEKKGYCVVEIMVILQLAETSVRDSFIIDAIANDLEKVLEDALRIKVLTDPEIKKSDKLFEGSAG